MNLPGFQQFWAEGFVELPPPTREYVLFEEFRADPQQHPLRTPSGKIEIASETIAKFGYDDCPPHPAWMRAGRVAWQCRSQRLSGSPRYQPAGRPGCTARWTQDRYRRPARSRDASRSASTRRMPRAAIIRDGDVVRVFNERGACLAGAIVDEGVVPSVAVMATGAWIDQSDGEPERHGNPNVLTLDVGTSRLTQGSSALTALVEIERWAGPLLPVRALTPPELVNADGPPAK